MWRPWLGGALCLMSLGAAAGPADQVVGAWRKVSDTLVMDGKPIDTQAALLQIRPCAAKILYRINTDGTFRLDASESGCDDKYKQIQEKLYSKTLWKLEGNKFMISTNKDFVVGQTYTVTTSGKQMTWVGTEGQGTLVFQK